MRKQELTSFDYSSQAQAHFVKSLLAQLNIKDNITLVVHDIGGMMGVPWAAQNVDKLHSMIYTNTVVFPYKWFDTAYRWGKESFIGKLNARFSMFMIGSSKGSLFRRIFAKQHPQLSNDQLDRFVTDFALNPIAKSTTLREFRKVTKDTFYDGFDLMRRAIADKVPTITIWGQGDPYITDNYTKIIDAGKTILLLDVGHWVPIIAADKIAAEIRLLHRK